VVAAAGTFLLLYVNRGKTWPVWCDPTSEQGRWCKHFKDRWRPTCGYDQLFAVMPMGLPGAENEPFHISLMASPEANRTSCLQSLVYGDGVRWNNCSKANPNQQWFFGPAGGLIHNRYHPACLSHADGNLSLVTCIGGDATKLSWMYDQLLGQLADNRGAEYGLCIDLSGGLQLQPCSGNWSQHLELEAVLPSVLQNERRRWPSGPLHLHLGPEAGPVNGSEANNSDWCISYDDTSLMLERCGSCSPNQQWVYMPESRQIMTFWHQRCLTRRDGLGLGAQLKYCNESDAWQIWDVGAVGATTTFSGLCRPPVVDYEAMMWGREYAISQNCTDGRDDVWYIDRLADWAERGGVEPNHTTHFFVPEELPPVLSEDAKTCSNWTDGSLDCGSEVLKTLGDNESLALFEELRYQLASMTSPHKVVVHAGDHRGLLFRFGSQYRHEHLSIASEMKPMTAVLVMRLVELGVIGLDDKANQWLNFWPTQASDSRSYVTLRHCLAFTSGFYGIPDNVYNVSALDAFPADLSVPQMHDINWYEMRCDTINPRRCAMAVLKHSEHIAAPGSVWTYTGDHFRIAIAMVYAATGKNLVHLLREHVFDRTAPAMHHTAPYTYLEYFDPASRTLSTPSDYQRFIDAYFRGQLISNKSLEIIEQDSQAFTQTRIFKGVSDIGRPVDHGLFGLGWWRSRSTKTLCGQYHFCNFAPSHYGSVAVIERKWPEWHGVKTCSWARSSSCSFYFHFQNVGFLDSEAAKELFRPVSHLIEDYMMQILSGRTVVNVTYNVSNISNISNISNDTNVSNVSNVTVVV